MVNEYYKINKNANVFWAFRVACVVRHGRLRCMFGHLEGKSLIGVANCRHNFEGCRGECKGRGKYII